MQESLYLYFDDLEHPLRLTGCEHLAEFFPVLFPEYGYHLGAQDDNPLISIQFNDGEYHFSAAWLDTAVSYPDKVDVLCDLIAKLAVARSFTDLETLYLHAAGVMINGRAIVFPSQYHAGKSFLTTCLAAQGHLYIGDDVFPLALDSSKGLTAGFAPRLRIPLPDSTDEISKHFIESHTALAGKRYAYLDFGPDLRLAQNELVDIGAFVLLEREQGTQAHLEELPVATVFQQLIKQNFAREIDAARILSTLTSVVSNAQCMRLRYDRADEAVRLLTEHFSSWPTCSGATQAKPDAQALSSVADKDISNKYFIRNDLVQKIRIEDESFLSSPDGKAIYHLNQIGSGIWELLAAPTSKETIISTLETAFPGVEKSAIEKDVTSILKRFQLKNLVIG